MEKDKIELKTRMETAEVADYLAALAKGFKAGRIVVEKNGEQLMLTPAALCKAEVEIEARLKKDKAKFSLELCWTLAQEQEEAAEFKISSELPKPTAAAAVKKPEDKKPAPQPATPAAATTAAAAKSDVKPAPPAASEPGGKGAGAAAEPAKAK